MAKDLVSVADLLTLEFEDPRCARAGLASQRVPFTVGDEREVPAPKHPLLRLAALEQDLARDRDAWNHMYPGIGGSVSPQGALSSDRQ